MLIDALRDESIKLRLQAVEYAASLSTELSAQVLEQAVIHEKVNQIATWWATHCTNYDEFMLRVDL